MEILNEWLGIIVGKVWGLPMIVLLCGSGIVLTLATGGIQLRGFFHAIQVVRGKFDDPNEPGQISHFAALCTALSATVGLGNIAGVAVAISIGGPGATFWMVVVGLLGMATKFAECSLGVMYRKITPEGIVRGGAMHYIELGLGKSWKPLAVFFACAAIFASFGAANMFQTNQVASILHSSFEIPRLATGITLAVFVAIVIIGGIQRIGQVTSKLVPFMGGIYVIGSLIVIFSNFSQVPGLLLQIVTDAFTGTAATGGFAGVVFAEVLKNGVKRACFSNEAGLGSAPIAHSAVATNEPIREGVVALLEPFIDTVVICTMTALVILISGAWTTEGLTGVNLTAAAFDSAIPGFGQIFVPVAVCLFAYSTLLSWSYYGEQATEYLFGEAGILPYKIVFCILAVLGSIWAIGPVLNFSDIMLGLMVVPNLIAVLMLLPKLLKESKSYFERLDQGKFNK